MVSSLCDAEEAIQLEDPTFSSIIKDRYRGTSASQVFCLHCNYRNLVFSPFFDISLSLNPHSHSISSLSMDSNDDLTILSKDPHAESKKIAGERYIELRTQLELQSKAGHVDIPTIGFEETENLVRFTKENPGKVLVPSPLDAKHSKPHAGKQDSSNSLEDILFNNFREDFLNNRDNFYICSTCDKQQKITENDLRYIVRRSFIAVAPPILCLTFKRFKKASEDTFSTFTKNSMKIAYPLVLDISNMVIKDNAEEKAVYELYGVVNHSGNLQSGHYTAYVRHLVYNEIVWYYYSDQYYKKVEEKDVLNNANAFMLYYKKIDGATSKEV